MFNNYNEQRTFERKNPAGIYEEVPVVLAERQKWINKIALHKVIPLKIDGGNITFRSIEVHYVQRLPELYFLPMTFITLRLWFLNAAEYRHRA